MSSYCQRLDFIECHVAGTLWKIVSPLLLVVGVIGNIVSIAVLSRQRMRHTTTSVYLRLLAVFDTVVLLVVLPRKLIYFHSSVEIKNLNVFACKFVSFLIPSSATLSWCLLSIITIDRLILIRYPVWAKKHCTRKSALVVSAILVSVIVAVNFHSILFQTLRWKEVISTANTTVRVNARCIPISNRYSVFREKAWPLIILVVFSITPIILQIVCNVLLARELVIRSQKRQASRSLQDGNDKHERELRSVTRMLTVVSVFFVISSVPQCIQLTLQPYIFKPRIGHNIAKSLLLKAVIQLLMYSNNAFNFLLYTLSGNIFRKELWRLCDEVKHKMLQRIGRNVIHPDVTLTSARRIKSKIKTRTDAVASGSNHMENTSV